jgi:hypothetical protein
MRSQHSIGLALVVVVFIGLGAPVLARGGNPFQTIQDTLNGLVASVNQISDNVTPGNVRRTGPLASFTVSSNADLFSCTGLNVSAETRSVTVALHDGFTGERLTWITRSLMPGQGTFVLLSAVYPRYFQFCSITVDDGTAHDVRGLLQVTQQQTGQVHAALPAE